MSKEMDKRRNPMRKSFIGKMFRGFLFVLLQIIFLPLMIIGLLHGLYREMYIGRRMAVSFSAGQALQYRYYMHYFGTRQDQATVDFVKAYPCESHFGLWSVLGAVFMANRLFGFTMKQHEVPEKGYETLDTTSGARVAAFDAIIEKYKDQVEQVVLPGAGYDLICLKYLKDWHGTCFELDQKATLALKVHTMTKAGLDHSGITYIPVDYETESWRDKLLAAGFDPGKKTLFLWQSVSLFLEESQVVESLKAMADLCSADTIIAQDFYSERFVRGETARSVRNVGNMMARMGEPWKFGLAMNGAPRQVVSDFLDECGLSVTSYHQFGQNLGEEPYYCIVEAKRK